ncbi:MAG TPA: FeoA family protein [Bacteroidota bacterium]|nr:FeoA family protein [Bacteroidota bacterium]
MEFSDQCSTLGEVPIGCDVIVKRLRHSVPGVSTRLRELGICENATILPLLRANGNMICVVNNMRIGIDESLARAILVTPRLHHVSA